MKVLVVDDEKKSRDTLLILLQNYCEEVTITGSAGNIDDAARQIALYQPDLLLLDISMPGGSGFELLEQLQEIPFEIIFITAYDHFAMQAIKANALDYLLKPVSIGDLRGAIQKAKKRHEEKSRYLESIRELLLQVGIKKNFQDKIAVPANDGLVFIAVTEIISLAADRSYTNIYLKNGKKITSTRALKEYEDQLPPDEFFRAHHSHIINMKYIQHYRKGEGGSVTMEDGSEIMISKRKKKDFLERFYL